MKRLLTYIFLFSFSGLTAQPYSRLIPDSSINQFMNWYFTRHDTLSEKRLVKPEIILLRENEFSYPDSTGWNDVSFLNNVFVRLRTSDKIFSRTDADYFVRQIKSIRRSQWKLKTKAIRYADPASEDDPLHPVKTYFSYSIPLFTEDRQYVILVRSFYCGLVCGGGGYVIFHKHSDGNWQEIKEYSSWNE